MIYKLQETNIDFIRGQNENHFLIYIQSFYINSIQIYSNKEHLYSFQIVKQNLTLISGSEPNVFLLEQSLALISKQDLLFEFL